MDLHMLFCEEEWYFHWRRFLVVKRCTGVISAKSANDLLLLVLRGAGSALQNAHPVLVLLYIHLDFRFQRRGESMVFPMVHFSLVSLVCKKFLSNIVQGDKILLQQRGRSLAFIGPVNSNRRTQIEI